MNDTDMTRRKFGVKKGEHEVDINARIHNIFQPRKIWVESSNDILD